MKRLSWTSNPHGPSNRKIHTIKALVLLHMVAPTCAIHCCTLKRIALMSIQFSTMNYFFSAAVVSVTIRQLRDSTTVYRCGWLSAHVIEHLATQLGLSKRGDPTPL